MLERLKENIWNAANPAQRALMTKVHAYLSKLRWWRLLLPDKGIAPYPKDYNPNLFARYILKLRFVTLRFGIPLTRNDARILSFKDRFKGQTGVLIGNGPSLNSVDFSKIEDLPTFGSNAIYLNSKKMGFSPTHIFVEDTFVAEDRADEINHITGSVLWFGSYLRYALNPRKNTCIVNVSMDYNTLRSSWPNFSYDASRILYTGGSVSYLQMQLAWYMGIKRLILVGFDHSYSLSSDAIFSGTGIRSVTEDSNHFDPSYFGPGKRWHDPMVSRMEVAYKKANQKWLARGRVIINCTAGGRLEAFVRMSLDQALSLDVNTEKRLISLLKHGVV